MRKTKILLSVLGAPSKALAQQGRLINRDVHLRAEIVHLRFLKGSIDSRSYPLTLSLTITSRTGDRSLYVDGQKNVGGKWETRDSSQARQTCIHLYDVRVHIQYITFSL